MRFNSKELAYLAQETKNLDKEGTLWMKDKQEGLFKKGEAYLERLFRLRGNLLFYFKSKDHKSEPIGLLVLERCTIELDTAEEFGNCFMIVYEGEEHTYHFASKSEKDRDAWIQALHIASYECLKMQFQSLREQLQAKTGKDPIKQHLPLDTGFEFETQSGNMDDDPAVEICLACEDLPNDSSGHPPNPLIVLYTIVPPQQNWIQHNHTEIVENNNNPKFQKTVGFGDLMGVDTCTRVKLTVFHVKERMTGIMSQLGQVIFTLQDVLMPSDMLLKLELQGSDPSGVGSVTIMAWINDASISVVDIQEGKVVDEQKRLSSSSVKRRSKRMDTLKPLYNNLIARTFLFDTSDTKDKLLVHEYMGESKFTFSIPIMLLRLLIEEENQRISLLQELGQLSREWNSVCKEMTDFSMSSVTMYTQSAHYLLAYKGPSFKPSVKKADKELEFIPINLHIQRMTVTNESLHTNGYYDIITAGAFTAYAQRYKFGGIQKMLHQQRELFSAESTLGGKTTKMDRACELINTVALLKQAIVQNCDRLCHVAMQGTSADLQKAIDVVAEKVRELVQLCAQPVLHEIAERYAKAKSEAPVGRQLYPTQTGRLSRQDMSPEKSWKWSGSDFVKSPTAEPWELTRLNTEAAVVCLISMVEDLIKNKTGPMDRPKWLGDISPSVIKLKSFVEIVQQKVNVFMTFLSVMENRGNFQLMQMIKYRRDIIFSHALTTLVTGFMTIVNASIKNKDFCDRICKVGILIQFEGLLSCHGDELSMIEDMTVAVNDLCSVTFKLVEESKTDKLSLAREMTVRTGKYPDLCRHSLCVTVPLSTSIFEQLPPEIQQGKKIAVVPVFFNVGINEQATLAETFGDTSLQERVNSESVARLYNYIEQIETDIGSLDHGKQGAGTITDLSKQLHYNVMIKKSKNTEILRLAAELCHKLDGIRVTSCKSAKDRTSMSVTLEQVQFLQQEHDLASHVFSQALDCFRSEGVRRENAYKNVGTRKYAFNSLQLLYIPKPYRAPSGTYGNVQG